MEPAADSGQRILVDGTMARGGGGFTYLVNIVPRLARLAPDHRFRVMLRSRRLAESLPAMPNVEVDLLPECGLRERFRFTYLEAPRLAADWRADLYYSAGESVPLSAPCPVIASFQNPNVFTGIRQWPWNQQLRLRLLRAIAGVTGRRAERVLFVSRDSAQWMGDAMGLPERKRAWLHHGIDADVWRPPPHRPRGGEHILSVSSIYRYKNYVRLIEAYAELAKRRPQLPDLVIIGDDQDPPYSAEMEKARRATGDLAERIHIVGEVPYAEIQRYYAKAALFVFPSLLETFGIPMIEAMAAEIPLVASDIPVFREIAGDAAFFCDARRPASLACAMEDALFSEDARDVRIKRGRERVREFTWDRSARRLLALFEEVLRSP
jgi:glycosyltransferase involved in cell wall biosynthesis